MSQGLLTLLYKIPTAFRPKNRYSYIIEIADSESDLGLYDKALVSKIFAFYHLLENALGRTGRRGHVQLGNYRNVFKNFEGFEGV